MNINLLLVVKNGIGTLKESETSYITTCMVKFRYTPLPQFNR